MLKAILKTFRIKQWAKNLLIFAPLIFAQDLNHIGQASEAIMAFVSFCLISSTMYFINDINDVLSDRYHPIKRLRPIAAGEVSIPMAYSTSTIILFIGLLLAYLVGFDFLVVAFVYLVMTFSYSQWLKKVVILDVLMVAFGFVLRAYAGSVAIGVVFSPWLLVTTLFLALFLTLGKRRHELVILGDKASTHRRILSQYSREFLDQLIMVVGTSSLLSYTLYTLAPETVVRFGSSGLSYTLPIVIYGLFRYFYLIYLKGGGGDPTEVLYSDGPILISVGLWIMAVVVIIYS
jgi:4-hydroxybenzoate polyprenyltransferase